MKEGAGEDPFADDTDSTGVGAGGDSSTESADPDEGRSEANGEGRTRASDEERPRRQARMQIPYKFRRDGVQDGRDRVPLFLQGDTKSAEREAVRELEKRFDDSVSLTDLREALMMVGLDHLDEVETQMEAWGYGMTFED